MFICVNRILFLNIKEILLASKYRLRHLTKLANAKAERERKIQKLRAEQARNCKVNHKMTDDEVARKYAEEEVRRETHKTERNRLREGAAEAHAAGERDDKTRKWPC
jgi:cell division protein FtsB